jgi:hypothetical protein
VTAVVAVAEVVLVVMRGTEVVSGMEVDSVVCVVPGIEVGVVVTVDVAQDENIIVPAIRELRPNQMNFFFNFALLFT